MKISVLGTEYAVKFGYDSEVADGEVNTVKKTVRVKGVRQFEGDEEEKRDGHMRVLRHEIVHAFLDESGLTAYSGDETLVEWIAVMMPRMAEAMREAGAL